MVLATTQETINRRVKLQEGFYNLGMKTVENRAKMPLISEDHSKSHYLYQEVHENGIMTCAQNIVKGMTPKNAMAFGYDCDKHFPLIADGRMVIT